MHARTAHAALRVPCWSAAQPPRAPEGRLAQLVNVRHVLAPRRAPHWQPKMAARHAAVRRWRRLVAAAAACIRWLAAAAACAQSPARACPQPWHAAGGRRRLVLRLARGPGGRRLLAEAAGLAAAVLERQAAFERGRRQRRAGLVLVQPRLHACIHAWQGAAAPCTSPAPTAPPPPAMHAGSTRHPPPACPQPRNAARRHSRPAAPPRHPGKQQRHNTSRALVGQRHVCPRDSSTHVLPALPDALITGAKYCRRRQLTTCVVKDGWRSRKNGTFSSASW